MNPLVVVRTVVDKDDIPQARSLWVWCPGCEQAHRPQAALPDGSRPASTPYWDWNGATDDTFTISPSLLVRGWQGADSVCHSFIRDGQWEFLGDSTHTLAGQTVPMVPVPDWLVR